MSFPRYERYKESGVEWLGEVPEHWQVNRLKLIADVFPSNVDKKEYEDEVPVRLCNYTDVYYNDVITDSMELMRATATPQQVEKFTLRAGDTILTKDSETADDIAIAAYVPGDLPGVVCGYHLSIARPKPVVIGAFIKRVFDATYIRAQAEVAANGLTRVGLSQYALDNLLVSYPTPDAQFQIVQFLDQETAKIDALIEEQRRLIELLKEKRQAVISHAVTRGLNPGLSMKDSHIDWIGQVPTHWIVTRLGYFATVENGTTPSKEKPEYWLDGQIPWLASGEVNQLRITEASESITEQALAESSLRLLPEGTIVVGLVGQGKTRGMSAVLYINATINQNLAGVCPGSNISSDFVFYLFQAMYVSLREDGRGGNQAAINCQMLAAVQIPVPPMQEQNEIAAALNTLTEQTDILEKEANRVIQLLQERRSALISAAVTGKIDVRAYTPKEAA